MASTTKADSRVIKGKRAVQAADKLPAWAVRELRLLSRATGISFVKLLAGALGFGIYHLKEELGPTANLLASAEEMAKINPHEQAVDPERSPQESVPAQSETGPAGSAGLGKDPGRDDRALLDAPDPGGYGGGNGNLEARSDDAGERRDEQRAHQSTDEFVRAVIVGSELDEQHSDTE